MADDGNAGSRGPADRFRPLGRGPAFPLANKLERVVFRAAWLLLARFTPPPLFAWRRLLLRAFGAEVGRGARIYGSARVWLPRNLEVGEGAGRSAGQRTRGSASGHGAVPRHPARA